MMNKIKRIYLRTKLRNLTLEELDRLMEAWGIEILMSTERLEERPRKFKTRPWLLIQNYSDPDELVEIILDNVEWHRIYAAFSVDTDKYWVTHASMNFAYIAFVNVIIVSLVSFFVVFSATFGPESDTLQDYQYVQYLKRIDNQKYYDRVRADSLLTRILEDQHTLTTDDLFELADLLSHDRYYSGEIKVYQLIIAREGIREEQSKSTLSQAYRGIGIAYDRIGNLDSAIVWFSKEVDARGEANDSLKLAVAYNNLGVLSREAGKLELALNAHRHSLEIRTKLDSVNTKGIGNAYLNLGLDYIVLGQPSKALEELDNALQFYQADSANSVSNIFMAQVNIGNAYAAMHDYDTAIEKYHISQDIRKRELGVKYHWRYATVYSRLGETYALTGDTLSALNYYRLASENLQERYLPTHPRVKTIDRIIDGLKR